jgi:hypothetical protein
MKPIEGKEKEMTYHTIIANPLGGILLTADDRGLTVGAVPLEHLGRGHS